MKEILLVGAGGFTGSIARYGLSLLIRTASPASITFLSTFVVNFTGSVLIGIFFTIFAGTNNNAYLLCVTGFCGGFTTFSTFSLENLLFLKNGNYTLMALYILISVIVCIAGAYAGMLLRPKMIN